MKKRLFKMAILGIKQFKDPYYQGFAAQLSFYILLAIVPIILVVSQIMSEVFEQDIEQGLGWVLNLMGISLTTDIANLVTGGGNNAVSIVFMIVAVWAASRAQFAMLRITNFTITGGRNTGRGFIRDRIKAMGSMVITLLTIIFSLVAMIYGELFLQIALSFLGMEHDTGAIWLILRWPIAMVLYILMLGINYYVLPTVRVKVRDIIPGTIFAALGLLIVTVVYSIYATKFSNYNILYGSLASIAALMMWFYFLSWVLGLGVLFNKVWIDTRYDETKKAIR